MNNTPDNQTIEYWKRVLAQRHKEYFFNDPDNIEEWKKQKEIRLKTFREFLNIPELLPKYELKKNPAREENGVVLADFTIIEETGIRITFSFASKSGLVNNPVIIFLHGKGECAEDVVKRYSRFFLNKGVSVLAMDMRFHGRVKEDGEKSSKISLLFGKPMMGLILSDILQVVRAVRLLDGVNHRKLGITGISMGGRYSFMAASLCPEIKACCSIISVTTVRAMIMEEQLLGGLHNYPPGMLNLIDFDDLIPVIAPRPLLMVNGMEDYAVPISGRNECYNRAKKVYTLFNALDKVKKLDFPATGHQVTDEMMNKVSSWFSEELEILKNGEGRIKRG